MKKLSDELGKHLGRGFSVRSLEQCRKFYMTQKQITQTVSAVSGDAVFKVELKAQLEKITAELEGDAHE